MMLLHNEKKAMKIGRLSTWIVLVASAVIFMTGYLSPVMAQKDAGNEKDTTGIEASTHDMTDEHAGKLLSDINDATKIVQRYEREIEAVSQEDRLVLDLQIYSLGEKIIGDIHQLSEVLLEMEKKGSQTQLRQRVEDMHKRVTPRLWLRIKRLEKEIDDIRALRTKAKVGELFGIENRIDRNTRHLNTIYRLSLVHVQKMEKLGMDTKKAGENFVKLLSDRADKLSRRLELVLIRIEDLETQLEAIPGDADLTKELIAAKNNLSTNIVSLESILDLMETLDLNTKAHRIRLVSLTKDISSGVTGTGVFLILLKRPLKDISTWLSENSSKYLLKLFFIAGILFLFRIATRILRIGLKKTLDASNLNLSRLARRMLISWSSKLLMLFGILLALSQLGISVGPLLAGLGVAGFIVGFALQDTLGNFASGMMILLYRPYDVGDLVDVGGVFGTVDKMSLVSTSLLTLDNQLFVVPNSKIWGDVIKNVTAQKTRRVDMVFGISYSDDIPKAESLLMDILDSHEKVLKTPKPEVHLHTLGESSVDFVVRPWVNVDDYWDVYWDVTRAVKLCFDKEGVSIPFPQRDVHVYNEDNSAPSAA